jgi:hypothetical protein
MNLFQTMPWEFIAQNDYIATVVTVLFVLYAGMVGPQLPDFIRNLFDNPIIKILVFAFIAYKGNNDPRMAIIISIAFVIVLNYIAENKVKENFRKIELFRQYNV